MDAAKAKTARRLIEVLEFFDERNGQASVMDIARRFNRPQSSTSELLAILVEMGLLYKDPRSRTFTPTPRAALLGSMCQPALIRDGRLCMMIERLRAETGLGAAVLGMVGLEAQVFGWAAGASSPGSHALAGGARTPLQESVAGWLLLSTLPPQRREGALRRLRSEAPEDRKFNPADIEETVRTCRDQSFAVGPAGFGDRAEMCAVLLPGECGAQAVVLGLVFDAGQRVDVPALGTLMRAAVQTSVAGEEVVRLEDYRPRRGEAIAPVDAPKFATFR
jgi:DNA-binding IclR family transcriptional regulator